MIGRKSLHVTAERANFPLGALNVRAGSAANVALFDVPVRAGVSVLAVWMRVVNCDGESDDFAAVQTGTLWVVDVPASHFSTPGEVPNGVEVWASGTGADGEPYTWSIGVGDLCVLDGDIAAPVPGVAWTAIKLRETTPTNPVYGDAKIEGGALYVWDGTQWVGGGGGGGGIVDDTVTRTSSNAVKSSGIWSAIWGTLAALPSGFTALYDWVVSQLAGKVSKTGDTMTGSLKLKGAWLDFEDAETPADMGGIYVAGDASTGGTVLRLVQWQNGGMVADVALSAGNVATKADIPAASTSAPLADGVASPGASAAYARGDHVHPTDTSRAAASALASLAQTVAGKLNMTGETRSVTATDIGGTENYAFVGTGGVGNANAVARIKELPYVNVGEAAQMLAGVYAISSRCVQRHTATSGETSVTFGFADEPGAGKILDALLDIDNSANASALGLEFNGLGTTFALGVNSADVSASKTAGEVLAEMTSVEANTRARFYFTETAQTVTVGSTTLPVISIQRMTIEVVTTQGGA